MKKLALAVVAVVVASAAFAADDVAIKKQFEALSAAFTAKDAKAVAALFAEDGDLINPSGVYAKGRADIEKVAASDIEHFLSKGVNTFTVTDIRMLRSDIAIVNATHVVSGIKGPDGSAQPDLKVLVTVVDVKKGGKWLALAARPMIPFVPPAPAAAPAAAAPAAAPAAMAAPAAPMAVKTH